MSYPTNSASAPRELKTSWRTARLYRGCGPHVVVVAQVPKPLRTRSVPLTDELVVIGDDEQVVAPAGSDEAKEIVLSPVGVLEFVNADMRPAEPDHPGNGRLLGEQPDREMEQAAEVEPVGVDERATVASEEQRQPFRRGGQGGGRARTTVGLGKQSVDEVEQAVAIRRELQAAAGQVTDHLFEDGNPVLILREKTEVRADAQVASVLLQNVSRELVKRAELGTIRVFPEDLVHSLPHLGGGLARTGAGEDQKRAIVPVHGAVLVLVEILEGDHCESPLARNRKRPFALRTRRQASPYSPATSRARAMNSSAVSHSRTASATTAMRAGSEIASSTRTSCSAASRPNLRVTNRCTNSRSP